MSETLENLIEQMTPRIPPLDLDAPLRIDIKDVGSIRIEDNIATISDADAPCVVSTSLETFQGILDHKVYPATAMAIGKIKVKGDFGSAIKLSYIYNH